MGSDGSTDKRGWEKAPQIGAEDRKLHRRGGDNLPAPFGSNCRPFLRDRLIGPGEPVALMEWLIGVLLTGGSKLLGDGNVACLPLST